MRAYIVLACEWMLGGACVLAIQATMPAAVDWNALLPAVQELSKKEFRDAGGYYAISISRTADVTGDGVPEALIDFGCCGASTDEMTVMRIEGGKPVLALFREKDGKIAPGEFLEGASVMHGAAVKLNTKEHAVFYVCWNMNGKGTKLADCGGQAYRWNAAAKRFDYHGALSTKLTKNFCRTIRTQLTAH